jgi:hypothetical protein
MGLIKVRKTGSGLNCQKIILILLVALTFIGMYGFIRSINNAVKGPQRMQLYYKGAKRFSEESKTIYLKGIAGFWAFDLEKIAGGALISKRDRLEIKENGIIWEVVEWKMKMPGVDTTETFYHIRTAFINPYGVLKGDSLSDVYILSQEFIGTGDTCFGGYNYSELWKISRRGESIEISKRNYRQYKGDREDFYPPGKIDMVEKSENQLYYDTIVQGNKETRLNSVFSIRKTDANTGKVTLFPIRDSINGLNEFFRIKLEKVFLAFKDTIQDKEYIERLLEKYYQPFIVDEQWRMFPRDIPKIMKVFFIVRKNGSVDSVTVNTPDVVDRMFTADLTRELKSWRFPALRSQLQIAKTFIMP